MTLGKYEKGIWERTVLRSWVCWNPWKYTGDARPKKKGLTWLRQRSILQRHHLRFTVKKHSQGTKQRRKRQWNFMRSYNVSLSPFNLAPRSSEHCLSIWRSHPFMISSIPTSIITTPHRAFGQDSTVSVTNYIFETFSLMLPNSFRPLESKFPPWCLSLDLI